MVFDGFAIYNFRSTFTKLKLVCCCLMVVFAHIGIVSFTCVNTMMSVDRIPQVSRFGSSYMVCLLVHVFTLCCDCMNMMRYMEVCLM